MAFCLRRLVGAQDRQGNLFAPTAWLPLFLACLEISLRVPGWAGHGLGGVAALIFGVQALAPHGQHLMLGGGLAVWQIWESVVYVGIVRLVLAVVAAVSVRRWVVTFIGVAAVVRRVAALDGYGPFGLYELVWHGRGMRAQCAPRRFTLVTT